MRRWQRDCAMIFQQFNLVPRLDVVTNETTTDKTGLDEAKAAVPISGLVGSIFLLAFLLLAPIGASAAPIIPTADLVVAGVVDEPPPAGGITTGNAIRYEITFTNKIPDAPLNKNYSKTNIHSHFVQFDPQASDGLHWRLRRR